MAEFTLTAASTHNRWNRDLSPQLTVGSGATVHFECLDSSGGQLGPESTLEDFLRIDRNKIHTLTGPVFVKDAQPGDVLREAEQIADQVREAASGKTGSLSIGFVGTAMYDIIPRALRIYRSAFPKIQLNLEDIHSGHQVQALRRRKIDVGFIRPPVQDAKTKKCCPREVVGGPP